MFNKTPSVSLVARIGAIMVLLLAVVAVQAQAPEPDENTLVVAQSVDAQSMDPPQIGARPDANIASHIFGSLLRITVDGDILPYLAESFEFSEAGDELIFTLRDGLTCHDGSPLTADDVVYTFQRAADPEIGRASCRERVFPVV